MTVSVSQRFRQHIEAPDRDETVQELRRQLTRAKSSTRELGACADDAVMREKMPAMYQQIVAKLIQLATSEGLGVACALEAYDELHDDCSISQFDREQRQQLNEIGVNMKRRHSSRIAKIVAEVEAQRLAWRHAHEFLSWLAFRRDDERYPAADRLERMAAFKVQSRLLQSRDTLIRFLGAPLCAALEAHDRFMLANRWKLSSSLEHRLEAEAWTLLSFQPGELVRVELARMHHDALVRRGAPPEQQEASRRNLLTLFVDQLAWALERVPDSVSNPVL